MFEGRENNIVLNKNSVEGKPCINRECKNNELTIQLYSCHDINMKFLAVVTPTSIYKVGAFKQSTGTTCRFYFPDSV